MNIARRIRASAMLILIGVVAHDGEATAAPPEPPPPPPFHRFGLTVNLLAPATSTYQVSAEWMITPRDSVTFAPWLAIGHATGQKNAFSITGDSSPSYSVDFTGVGVDGQLRHYFGDWYGGNGPFLAAGVDLAHFQVDGKGCTHVDVDDHSLPCVNDARQSFGYAGPTADAGIQGALASGLTFGGSLGVRYRVVLGDVDRNILPSAFDVAHGPGFGARVRLWVGWSFL